MSKRANTTLIGAFVVGAISLLTIAIIMFGGETFFNRQETVVMYFDGSVDGLQVGAPSECARCTGRNGHTNQP